MAITVKAFIRPDDAVSPIRVQRPTHKWPRRSRRAMKGERPVKIRLMRDQLRINCEESSPDVLRLSVALCAKCVARLVPFACRPCSARSPAAAGQSSFLPPCGHSAGHAIRAQRRRPSQCSPFHSQFSLPLLLSPSRSPHLAVNVFLGFASALSLCHVAGRRRWPCLSLSIRRDPSVHR